jgi:hypothetical protein
MTKIVLQILLYLLNVSSTNVEEEIKKTSKLVSCSDYKDLANKNMEDTIISYNSPKDILKDYLEVSLYTKVEVLEVIDDDGVKFEKKKECVKELQVNFIGTKNITLNMDFSLAFNHHKLNYFMNMLAIMHIRSICSFRVEEFNS